MICCKTIIGFGAPNKQGTAATHGAPLGEEEIAAARQELGWSAAPFEIPAEIAAAWDARERGAAREHDWNTAFAAYNEEHPKLAAEFARRMAACRPCSLYMELNRITPSLKIYPGMTKKRS